MFKPDIKSSIFFIAFTFAAVDYFRFPDILGAASQIDVGQSFVKDIPPGFGPAQKVRGRLSFPTINYDFCTVGAIWVKIGFTQQICEIYPNSEQCTLETGVEIKFLDVNVPVIEVHDYFWCIGRRFTGVQYIAEAVNVHG